MNIQRVYKYPLLMKDVQRVQLPLEAEILSAQMQNGVLCLWAKVQIGVPDKVQRIWIRGTGHGIEDEVKFIDTVQDNGLVWHIFGEET